MQTRSDDLIRDDVLFELKWDPKIGSSSDIAVAVKDGVVTLSGSFEVIGIKCSREGGQARLRSAWRGQ